MVSAYSVKIGGSPSAPGNVYATATKIRYGRGINRSGSCQFDLYGLNGRTDPAQGDYVQVLYGATVVWDGFIREIKREIGDIIRHVTAADGLMELDRRDVDSRRAYAAANEGTIAADILTQVGVTGASTPIRQGTMSAGAALTTYRVEYANALKALRALASVNARELAAEYDAGTGTTKIHFRTRTGDYAASQATWRATRDMVGSPTLQTDNWEQMDNVRVLGQGDGTQSDGTYGATTGAAGNNRAVVPAKNIDDTGVAGSYAATLKAAFNDPRLVIVAPMRFFNLEVDQGINIGDRVTIESYDGASIGDFRVFFLETDPNYTDGWFTRVTLIRALTSGGAAYPALPVVSDAQGVTYPGLTDQQVLVNDPQTYTQNPATSSSQRIGASQANLAQPAAGGSGSVMAAGGVVSTVLSFTNRSFDPATDDVLQIFVQVQCNSGAANTYEIHVTENASGTDVFADFYSAVNDGYLQQIPITLTAQMVADFIGAATVTGMTLTIINRSAGAVTATVVQISAWVMGPHVHVAA